MKLIHNGWYVPDDDQKITRVLENDSDKSTSSYEGRYRKQILEHLPNKRTFIDVGANFGIYSLRISKFFKTLKIIAFEPVSTTFNKLKVHIKINNLEKKIKIYNMGLSNTNGLKKMIAMKRRNYIQSGGFSFNIPKRKLSTEETIQYHKSIIGDKILKFKKKKIAIKIDVEGYENKVLLGIKNLLKN